MDESLTASENIRVLSNKYPALARYVHGDGGPGVGDLELDDCVDRAYMLYLADLITHGNDEDREWAEREAEKLGFGSVDELLDEAYKRVVDGAVYIILDRWLSDDVGEEVRR